MPINIINYYKPTREKERKYSYIFNVKIMNKYSHTKRFSINKKSYLNSGSCTEFDKKYFFNMAFTHIGLVCFIALAVIGGGFLFQTLERHASIQKWYYISI